jgi:hypothetical protein
LNVHAAAAARDRVLAGCGTLRAQLRGLTATGEHLAGKVHDLRRLGKAVRGGCALFLLHDSAGREIQAVGRLLSGTRDATSRRQTWLRLDWEGGARPAAAIRSLLYQESRAVIRRYPPQAIGWCLDRVDSAIRTLRELPEGELAETLEKGVARLQRRVFRRCGRLEPGSPGFHAARKAIKAWLGALGFLPEWLLGHGFTDRFVPGLWKTLCASRNKLQRRVIRHLPELRGWPHGPAIQCT